MTSEQIDRFLFLEIPARRRSTQKAGFTHLERREGKKMDYKELIEQLRKHHQSWAAYSDLELAHDLEDAITAIETLLAEREAAIKVVRCKDCRHCIITGRSPFMCHVCNRNGVIVKVDEDDFCKYGATPDYTKEDTHD